MSEVPDCIHRGEITGETCVCTSNRLVHSGIVPLSICGQCPYRNRPNVDNLPPVAKASTPPPVEPCKWRGPVIRSQGCDLCGLRSQSVQVHYCGLHGECSLNRQHSKIKSCAACEERTVEWSRKTDIAPLRWRGAQPWQGCAPVASWQRRVTVMIPVFHPGEHLDMSLELWRQQTERPNLLLVDTGSSREALLSLWDQHDDRSDLEIHAMRCHGFRSSSEPVAQAIDVAVSLCQTEYLLLTHDDVFPKRRDLIEFLLWLRERHDTPVVGWEMSDRTAVCGNAWRGMVSHTCTLLHVPSVRGLSWSMDNAHREFGLPRTHASWPDTETGFNLLLKQREIKPLLLGPEINYERQQTRWWDHCRSYTGSGMYHSAHRDKAEEWMTQAIDSARERLALWRPLDAAGSRRIVTVSASLNDHLRRP